MNRWFSYDPNGDGFVLHETREAAQAAAEKALAYERENAGEGWSDETEMICWGEVRSRAQETERKEVPAGVTVIDGLGSDGVDYSDIPAGCDAFVDYDLVIPADRCPCGCGCLRGTTGEDRCEAVWRCPRHGLYAPICLPCVEETDIRGAGHANPSGRKEHA